MISEVDLKNLKEYWAERCMFEVMKLEGCIFDKIDKIEAKLERQIRDMGSKQENDIRTLEERLQQQSETDAQKLHRRLETLRQEQRAETAEVLSSTSVRPLEMEMSAQISQYQMQLEAVEASLADLRRELGSQLQHRDVQADALRIAEEKWSQWEAARSEQAAGFKSEQSAKVEELAKALEEVSRRCNDCDSKFQDAKQDQMCELVTIRGRFEASIAEHDDKLTRLESLTTQIKDKSEIKSQSVSRTPSPEAETVSLINKHVETLSVDLAVLSKRFEAQERAAVGEAKMSSDSGLSARVDAIEGFQSMWTKRFEPLEGLQEDLALQGAALRALKDQFDLAYSNQNNSAALRATLTATRTDVGLLASQLAEEIQERQKTLADVGAVKGQIVEDMSKTVERMEQRFASERMQTQQLITQMMTRVDCLDRLDHIASAGSSNSGDNDGNTVVGVSTNSDLARTVGRCVGEMEAGLRTQLTARINSLQSDLHSMQTEVAAHVSSMQVRLAAVEAGTSAAQAGLKPISEDITGRVEAALKLAGRASSVPGESNGTSSRATSHERTPTPTPIRDRSIPAQRSEPDTSVLEAIQENMERGLKQVEVARSQSPARPSLSQDTARRSPAAAQSLMTKDLKNTLQDLAHAVHRTLADPTESPQGQRQPGFSISDGLSRGGSLVVPRGSMQKSPESTTRPSSGQLTSSPDNTQSLPSTQEMARQISLTRNSATRQGEGDASLPMRAPSLPNGARAPSPMVSSLVSGSSSNLGPPMRPNSVQADQNVGRTQGRGTSTASPFPGGIAPNVSGSAECGPGDGRGRQARSLQPPGHSAQSPSQDTASVPRSRQTQSAAPTPLGTPQLSPAAARVNSRVGYISPTGTATSPQVLKARGFK